MESNFTETQLQHLSNDIELAYLELASCPEPTRDELEDSSFYFVNDERSSIWAQICEMEAVFAEYVHTCEDPTVLPF